MVSRHHNDGDEVKEKDNGGNMMSVRIFVAHDKGIHGNNWLDNMDKPHKETIICLLIMNCMWTGSNV